MTTEHILDYMGFVAIGLLTGGWIGWRIGFKEGVAAMYNSLKNTNRLKKEKQ